MNRTWFHEIRELCRHLDAACDLEANQFRIQAHSVTLKLVPLEDHVLVSIGIETPSGTRWVGLETVPFGQIVSALMNILPLESVTSHDLAMLQAFKEHA